jgi:hypothetical protein
MPKLQPFRPPFSAASFSVWRSLSLFTNFEHNLVQGAQFQTKNHTQEVGQQAYTWVLDRSSLFSRHHLLEFCSGRFRELLERTPATQHCRVWPEYSVETRSRLSELGDRRTATRAGSAIMEVELSIRFE